MEDNFAQLDYISFQILDIVQDGSLETPFSITSISNLREQKIYEGSFKMMKNKTQNLFSIFF